MSTRLLSRVLDLKLCWNFVALVCPAEKQSFRVNKTLCLVLILSSTDYKDRISLLCL